MRLAAFAIVFAALPAFAWESVELAEWFRDAPQYRGGIQLAAAPLESKTVLDFMGDSDASEDRFMKFLDAYYFAYAKPEGGGLNLTSAHEALRFASNAKIRGNLEAVQRFYRDSYLDLFRKGRPRDEARIGAQQAAKLFAIGSPSARAPTVGSASLQERIRDFVARSPEDYGAGAPIRADEIAQKLSHFATIGTPPEGSSKLDALEQAYALGRAKPGGGGMGMSPEEALEQALKVALMPGALERVRKMKRVYRDELLSYDAPDVKFASQDPDFEGHRLAIIEEAFEAAKSLKIRGIRVQDAREERPVVAPGN